MRNRSTGFWQALETVPGAAAVDAEWKGRFGSDYGTAKAFLRPNGKLASSYPCMVQRGCGCEHEVVVHNPEDIVAVCRCERGCETFALQRSDIVVYELDRPALDTALAKVFGLIEETDAETDLPGTTRIGVYSPYAGYRFPVYLAIQIEPDDFSETVDGLLGRNGMPFILLSPTRELCSSKAEKRLTDKRSGFVSLSESVAIGDKRQLRLLRPLDEILAQFRGVNLPPPKEDGATAFFPTPPDASWDVWTIPTTPMYLGDLVDAMLAMPAKLAAPLVEKAAQWAERPYWLLPEKLGRLIEHWAKGGQTEEALRVARVLLDVLPDERRMEAASKEDYWLPPEPRARFDTWDYEEILKKYYPELVKAAGLPALEVLCDLLEKIIRLSRPREDDHGPEDYSYVRRPAIEEHPQNLGHTIKDALVSGVRDAAELTLCSRKATMKEVVDALERRRWKVFQRIALHVLRVFADRALPLIATRLTNRNLFDDVGAQHEYILLMRACFSRLTEKDQAKILGWIEAGPDIERFRQRWQGNNGSAPSNEEVIRYRKVWQRDWLARIGPENLPQDWQERYRTLVKHYGEPEHPEFSIYREGGWVGPTSPKTAEDIKAMSVEEIVGFLKTWRTPDNVFREPSPEGLGRVLSSVVAQDPGPFAVEAKRFQGLDPTYVRAVLFGLRNGFKQARAFDWESVLDLCQWVLAQQREIEGRRVEPMEADSDWGGERLKDDRRWKYGSPSLESMRPFWRKV